MRHKVYIGSYEGSWNETTWKDWLLCMIVLGLLALFMIGIPIYYSIIGGVA